MRTILPIAFMALSHTIFNCNLETVIRIHRIPISILITLLYCKDMYRFFFPVPLDHPRKYATASIFNLQFISLLIVGQSRAAVLNLFVFAYHLHSLKIFTYHLTIFLLFFFLVINNVYVYVFYKGRFFSRTAYHL
ncbi:unnamed protein product [Aphis gossypii]|uniref:Uncharacterized protein n=1 Tax=Aphis gossypii TaxID=80765 RepID=A0A9P0NE88_APHGO|nr:unnamed protein product [Aphis gossypii]